MFLLSHSAFHEGEKFAVLCCEILGVGNNTHNRTRIPFQVVDQSLPTSECDSYRSSQQNASQTLIKNFIHDAS